MEGQLYLLTYGNESRGGAWRAEDDQFHIAALEFLRPWKEKRDVAKSGEYQPQSPRSAGGVPAGRCGLGKRPFVLLSDKWTISARLAAGRSKRHLGVGVVPLHIRQQPGV